MPARRTHPLPYVALAAAALAALALGLLHGALAAVLAFFAALIGVPCAWGLTTLLRDAVRHLFDLPVGRCHSCGATLRARCRERCPACDAEQPRVCA